MFTPETPVYSLIPQGFPRASSSEFRCRAASCCVPEFPLPPGEASCNAGLCLLGEETALSRSQSLKHYPRETWCQALPWCQEEVVHRPSPRQAVPGGLRHKARALQVFAAFLGNFAQSKYSGTHPCRHGDSDLRHAPCPLADHFWLFSSKRAISPQQWWLLIS